MDIDPGTIMTDLCVSLADAIMRYEFIGRNKDII